jgi:hypothetical protein
MTIELEKPLPVVPTTTTGQDPTPEELQRLDQGLTDAWKSVRERKFESALSELDKLSQLPMTDEGAGRYQRLHLLSQYAQNFDTALRDAISALKGGDELEVGTSTVVGVVETQPDQITVRVAGANRTYTTESLPPGLAIAVADTHLDAGDPVSLVQKAAYLATLKDARDDRLAKARGWFREAAGKGVDIGDLEKVLDDRYGD